MELVPLNTIFSRILTTMISSAPMGPRTKPPISSASEENSSSAKGERGVEMLMYIRTKATAPIMAAVVRRRTLFLFMDVSS